MVNNRRRTTIKLIPGKLHAPAKIYLFLVCKKVFIKSFHFMECTATDNHCSTGYPKNLFSCIILTFVFFTDIKYSSSRKWIAKAIQPTAGATGIFKTLFIVV